MKCVGLHVIRQSFDTSARQSVNILHANSDCVDVNAIELFKKLAKVCPETTQMVVEQVAIGLHNLEYDDVSTLLYWLLDEDIDGYDCKIYEEVNSAKILSEEVFIPRDDVKDYAGLDVSAFEDFRRNFAKIALKSFSVELETRIKAGILHEECVFLRSMLENNLNSLKELHASFQNARKVVEREGEQVLESASKHVNITGQIQYGAQKFLNLLLTFNERLHERVKSELKKRIRREREVKERIKRIEAKKEHVSERMEKNVSFRLLIKRLKEKAQCLYERIMLKIDELKQTFRRRGPSL